MEVLLQLAARAGDLVTREDLIQAVWGPHGGSKKALGHAISEIRHALDDPADHPRFVQTLRGRGYRLVVEPVPDPQAADTATPPDHEAQGWRALAELKRRGVVQTGITYVVVGWLLIQIGDATFDKLPLPWWSAPFLTILVIIGFPIALALAWFLDFAEGRWYVDRGRGSRTQGSRSPVVYFAVIGALVVATAGLSAYLVITDDNSIFGTDPTDVVVPRVFAPDIELPIRDSSIAVLRFLNIDGSPETQIFADGLAEDLIDRLARVPGLHVSSRGDAWSLPSNAASQEVRERLRVAYYLQGSVQLKGSVLRVLIKLIDSQDGSIRVPRSFEKVLDDLFLIQEQITTLTVASLRVALPPETQTILTVNSDRPSLDAYVLYRKGKAANDLPFSDESIASAIGFFQEALAVDPDYAAAYAGLCHSYAAAYLKSDDSRYIDKAEVACASAVETNANMDLVQDAVGNLYWWTGRDAEAERAYLRALEVNENDVRAMLGLAAVYRRQGRLQEAEEMHHRSIDLQPGNWRSINDFGGFLFANGRYAEAADQYQQVVFLNRDNWQGHGNLGTALMMAGDFERAVPALEKSLEIEPHRTIYSNLGVIYYYLGRFDESVAIHRKVAALAPGDSTVMLNLGDALRFSSTPELASEAFGKASDFAEQHLAVNPRDAPVLLDLAWAQAMLGHIDRADELIAQSLKIAPGDPYGYYYLALLETLKGRNGEALEALESAVDKGYPAVMLKNEPYLAALRRNARFVRLLAEATTDSASSYR
jgi:tetratricopeptide (TPR) repeat protein